MSATHNPASFGDSVVVLAIAELRLRIVRDRGVILTDLYSAREPHLPWNLERMYRLIHGTTLDGVDQLSVVLQTLKADLPHMRTLLSTEYEVLLDRAAKAE